MPRSDLLTTAEVAELLRMSRRAIYERLRRDPAAIPGVVRVGRRLLFRRSSLEAWIGKGGNTC